MLYSNEDFENFYVRYKAEGLPRNLTVKAFCIKNNVRWHLFDKWYRDTRHRICPVKVMGRPDEGSDNESEWTDDTPRPGSVAPLDRRRDDEGENEAVVVTVDIRMSNGMQIRQKNISCR